MLCAVNAHVWVGKGRVGGDTLQENSLSARVFKLLLAPVDEVESFCDEVRRGFGRSSDVPVVFVLSLHRSCNWQLQQRGNVVAHAISPALSLGLTGPHADHGMYGVSE